MQKTKEDCSKKIEVTDVDAQQQFININVKNKKMRFRQEIEENKYYWQALGKSLNFAGNREGLQTNTVETR